MNWFPDQMQMTVGRTDCRSVWKYTRVRGINLNHCKSHSHPELVYSLKRSVENLHVKLCFSVHGSTHTHSLIQRSGDHRLEIVQRPRPSRLFLTFSHTHTHTPPSMGLYVRSQAVCVQRTALIPSWRVLTGQISKCVRVSPPAGERARETEWILTRLWELGLGSWSY